MAYEQKFLGFKDGLPTGPEVVEIRAHWPNLKPGDRIVYAELSEIINVPVGCNRWRSVTNAWRAKERELGRVILCQASDAFYVATGEQITSLTHDVLGQVGRVAKRQRYNLATIRPTDAATRAVIEHQARLMSAVEKDARIKRMNILPSTKAPDQPRIIPPKVESAA